MLIEIKHVPSKRPGRWATATIYVLSCDHCGVSFEKRYCSVDVASSDRKHYHNRTCKLAAQTGNGSLAQKTRLTCIDRFGVDNPWKSQNIKDNIARTNMARYGHENVMQDPHVLSRCMKKRRHAYTVKHWKTNEELVCVGRYELAFVLWCNKQRVDFDWQVSHTMPDGRVYVVDAFIKEGQHAGNWIELKGWFSPVGKSKWEWFSSNHTNAELWDRTKLRTLGLIVEKGRVNPELALPSDDRR